jgi:hypothetical protein
MFLSSSTSVHLGRYTLKYARIYFEYMNFDETRKLWDQAGFTNDESRLGKPVPTGNLLVPNTIDLNVGKNLLVWVCREKMRADVKGYRLVQPTPGMFNGFVRLWQESPSAILRYARNWGMLYLDPLGTPCVKGYTSEMLYLDPQGVKGYAPDERREMRSEPIDTWKYFSRRAFAVLSIASSLKLRQSEDRCNKASPSDWAVFDGLEGRVGDDLLRDLGHRRGLLELYATVGCPYSVGWDIDKERRWMAREIMLWLEIGRPGFAVSEKSWRLEIDYNGCLFAAIALQLALTVTGAQNLLICSGCSYPYVREKKAPKPGQANYCEECGPNASLREANSRLRDRKAEARRLRAEEGLSVRKIAERMNVRTTKRSTALQTVSRWLGKEK